jgi:chemotaxis protein MotB
MAKKKHPEHVNHERWLVSYADFITLLFAFFVVMFASSQTDSVKVGRFVESFSRAIQWSVFATDGSGFLDGAPSNPMIADDTQQSAKPPKKKARAGEFEQEREIKGSIKKLQASAPILAGLKIEEATGELILRLPERLVFERGKAELSDEGRVALSAIADELAPRPVQLRVEGHTDSTPIHNAVFRSNWELSTARATAVISFFIEGKNFDPERLSAAGYAEFHPIADNDTEEGRGSNRRVDLVVTERLEGIGNQYLSQKVKVEKRAQNLTAPTVEPKLPETPAVKEPKAPEGAAPKEPKATDGSKPAAASGAAPAGGPAPAAPPRAPTAEAPKPVPAPPATEKNP